MIIAAWGKEARVCKTLPVGPLLTTSPALLHMYTLHSTAKKSLHQQVKKTIGRFLHWNQKMLFYSLAIRIFPFFRLREKYDNHSSGWQVLFKKDTLIVETEHALLISHHGSNIVVNRACLLAGEESRTMMVRLSISKSM